VTSSRFARVLLVGFMGAGKTSVGRAVANGLGWRFIDFDDVVEVDAGMSVAELFEAHGEAHFRELEHRAARRLVLEDRVVLGSGGGWAAVPGWVAELPEETATFWLQVSAETALERVAEQRGRRPLLDGADPLERAANLLIERSSSYREARWTVDTERSTVEDVSTQILHLLAEEARDKP